MNSVFPLVLRWHVHTSLKGGKHSSHFGTMCIVFGGVLHEFQDSLPCFWPF